VLSIAQQEPQFTQFWNNYSIYNPAHTASGVETISFASNYRTRFVDNGTNPQLGSANYEHSLKKINSRVGLGYVLNEIGLLNSNKIYLNYAYHLPLPKINGSLSVGISTDYQSLKFTPTTGWDWPISSNPISGNVFNVNFGLLFITEKLKLGISLTQMNEAVIDKVSFSNPRHLFALASYKFQLTGKIGYTPTGYLKTNFGAQIFELNKMFDYKKKLFVGVTYRHRDAIIFQLGCQLKLYTKSSHPNGSSNRGTLKRSPDVFKIMYSYDILTGPLSSYGFNAHEISLIYKIW